MPPENDRNEFVDLITRYLSALKRGDIPGNLFTSDVTIFTPFLETPVTAKMQS